MISWLREGPDHPADVPTWAGAESLVAELRLDSSGNVAAVPHRTYAGGGAFSSVALNEAPLVHDLDLSTATRMAPAAGEPFEVGVYAAGRRIAGVARAAGESSVVIERSGHDRQVLAGSAPAAGTAVFFDADILEVFTDGAYGAWRL